MTHFVELILINQSVFSPDKCGGEVYKSFFFRCVSIEVLFLHQMDSVTKLYLLVEDINV